MNKEIVFEAMKDLPEEFKVDDLIKRVIALIEANDKEVSGDPNSGVNIFDQSN